MKKIIFMLFEEDGHPFYVLTRVEDGTEFAYRFLQSKKHGCLLYEITEIGPRTRPIDVKNLWFWAMPDVCVESNEQSKRMKMLPEQFSDDQLFRTNRFCEQGILFCEGCSDYVPDDILCQCEYFWKRHQCAYRKKARF